ncbi:cytochrome P450 [Paraburkholderia sp. J12]|uniref:cytochrome P450 n=1 Tax=Paraburkholderia sp. J12 TaxID=2805432 RepID=UPI002ABE8DBA|nr:cytochrome P450 [Paraburkholderia sp. J12]
MNPLADPYPAYRLLREHAPVHAAAPGRWLVTRHADVEALLFDSRCVHWGQDAQGDLRRKPDEQALAEAMRLFAPSAPASPLRHDLSAAISQVAVERMHAELGPLCDRLLDSFVAGQARDAVAGYAHPVTLFALGCLLGLSRPQTVQLAEAVGELQVPFFSCVSTTGTAPPRDASVARLQRCLDELIACGEQYPGTTLLGRLCAGAGAGAYTDRAAPSHRLRNMLLVLIYAAHHNLANFIGNGLFALASQPDALRQLEREPGLIDRAVLELLRYDSPLQHIVLTARESFELHGCTIGCGDEILACVGSANRDDAVFTVPDRLDFSRANPQKLLSFGAGPWRCVGAKLALRIGSVVFAKIVARGFALAAGTGALRWHHTPIVQRGLVALPLLVHFNV